MSLRMAKHPAAALIAQDLGQLQHTNDRGEVGLIHLPGFRNAGAHPGYAQGAGQLAQAIGEAIIETLDKRHGYEVIHRTQLTTARARTKNGKTHRQKNTTSTQPTGNAAQNPPPTIPPRPQLVNEQQRQAIIDQLGGEQPVIYNREQSTLLITMLAANLMHILNDHEKLPWIKAEMDTAEDGFTLNVRIVAPGVE